MLVLPIPIGVGGGNASAPQNFWFDENPGKLT